MSRLTCLFAFVLSISSALAQEEQLGRHDTTIYISSKIFGEERTVFVYEPEFYWLHSDTNPVIYVLNSAENYKNVSIAASSLWPWLYMPEALIVGIKTSEKDFTWQGDSEGLQAFLNFLEKELIPFIDAEYRTQPFRILCSYDTGSAVSTLDLSIAKPAFNVHFITNPSFTEDNEKSLKELEESFGQQKSKNKVFLFSNQKKQNRSEFDELKALFEHSPNQLEWQSKLIDPADSIPVSFRSAYEGLAELYDEWKIDLSGKNIPSYKFLARHFRRISEDFGYEILPPIKFTYDVAMKHEKKKRFKKALEILEANTENFPVSWGAYYLLADIQKKAGLNEEAESSYQRAIELTDNETMKSFLSGLLDN